MDDALRGAVGEALARLTDDDGARLAEALRGTADRLQAAGEARARAGEALRRALEGAAPAPDPDPRPVADEAPDPPERPASRRSQVVAGPLWLPQAGEFELVDALLLASPWLGMVNGLPSDAEKVEGLALRLSNVSLRAADENFPWAFGDDGVLWGGRVYNLRDVRVVDVDARNLFGGSYLAEGQVPQVTSREGHGFYFDVAPAPGRRFAFRRVRLDRCGGNAIQLVANAGDPHRASGSAPAQDGGTVIVRESRFLDPCLCPSRGAYALSFFDVCSTISIQGVAVEWSGDYACPSWGWDGSSQTHDSRGCLVQRGRAGRLLVGSGSRLVQGDRPDRDAVSVNGSEVLWIEDAEVRGQVTVNPPNPYWWTAEPRTKRVVLRGVRGEGQLVVGGQVVGPITRDLDLTL